MPVTRDHRTFADAHGVTIHSYVWAAPAPRGTVQLLHGVGEYATRYERFAQALVEAGYSVYAEDHRGHGETWREQWGGDLTKLGKLGPGGVRAAVAAIEQFTGIIRDENPDVPLALFGHSLGSLFAQKMLDHDASPFDAAILSATAYRTPFHMESGDLNKRFAFDGATGYEWLSRDPEVWTAFAADPLTFDAQVTKLFGLIDAARLLGTPRRIDHDLPLLIMIGEDDTLGGPKSVQLLADAYRGRGGLTDVEVKIYPGARHETLNETNHLEVEADVVAWLDAHLAR